MSCLPPFSRLAQALVPALLALSAQAQNLTPAPAAPAAPTAAAAAGATPATPPVRPGQPITLNFVGAEIEAVARTMATLTGRNVVVDPRVRGTMNLATEKPVSAAQAFTQFTAALRLQGFALVEAQGLYKIVPEAEAKLQSGAVSAEGDGARAGAGNQILTQIFRLNHESANNLVAVLRPLISPNNTINVNPGTNALVITDYADNLQRLGRIIAALDVSNATDVEVIPLRHAMATDLAPLVIRLVETGGTAPAAGAQGQTDNSFKTTLLAEPRSNSLVLRAANPARVALVRSLVDKLDRPSSERASGNIHVVYLKNADAVQLAATLRAALAADNGTLGSASASGLPATAAATTRTSLGGMPGTAAGASAANAPVNANSGPSTGGQIQADPSTNSLIITAPEPQYRQLRAVIEQLDTRRAQVYVESLIVEVSADKAAEFGIQWQGLVGRAGNGLVGAIGTNFGTAGNILSLAAQSANNITRLPQTGLNIALAPRVNGTYYLGALARFLETEGDANILSTPNLLTLDNEEAKIVIGQNVPFVTGQYTNNNSNNGAVNPFQTIERKDVGLTLRVRPQIGEDGTVKMTLFQEVSSISPVESASGLITNKRSIESTVVVDDGAIVVLGGLLQDEYGGSQDKVPGLGDVPIFGNLFKSDKRTRKKSNLMVFLRPVVLRDGRQADTLAQDRYDMLRAAQQQVQPTQSDLLGVNEAPVLPPQMPAPDRALMANPLRAVTLPNAPGAVRAPDAVSNQP